MSKITFKVTWGMWAEHSRSFEGKVLRDGVEIGHLQGIAFDSDPEALWEVDSYSEAATVACQAWTLAGGEGAVYLERLEIAPELRGRGVGLEVMRALLARRWRGSHVLLMYPARTEAEDVLNPVGARVGKPRLGRHFEPVLSWVQGSDEIMYGRLGRSKA